MGKFVLCYNLQATACTGVPARVSAVLSHRIAQDGLVTVVLGLYTTPFNR